MQPMESADRRFIGPILEFIGPILEFIGPIFVLSTLLLILSVKVDNVPTWNLLRLNFIGRI